MIRVLAWLAADSAPQSALAIPLSAVLLVGIKKVQIESKFRNCS
jgi:hypothetical protein